MLTVCPVTIQPNYQEPGGGQVKSLDWTKYYSSRDKFKIVSHWRPEWCSRGAFTVGLVVALKHLCNKFEVSRCWGHSTQDTRKLRSLKKCRTALQAELPVTIQLLFCHHAQLQAFVWGVKKKERAGWAASCLCLRCQWQLTPFVLGVKSSLCTALTPYCTVVTRFTPYSSSNTVVITNITHLTFTKCIGIKICFIFIYYSSRE